MLPFSSSGLNFGLKLLSNKRLIPPKIDPYLPDRFQVEIHESKAKYNALIGSPGLGKTVVGSQEVVNFIKNGHGNGLIVLPSFNIADDVTIRELRKWVPKYVRIPISIKNSQKLYLPEGRVIWVKSGEAPDGFQGLDQITFVWLDEPEDIKEDIWVFCKERLHRQKSGLAKNDRLRVVITGVADLTKGRSWVRDEILTNAQKNNPDYFFRRATVWESSRYTDAQKEQLKRDNPLGTWARNRLEGIYAPNPKGLVYPELPVAGWHLCKKYELNKADKIIAGVDNGYRDPFVFVLIGVTKDDKDRDIYTIYDEYRSVGENEDIIASKICDLLERYDLPKNITIYHDHDPIQNKNIRNNMREAGFDPQFKPALKRDKEKSTNYLRDLFIKNQIQFAHETDSYYDFVSHKYKESGVREEVEHEFSHGTDAVRYALYTYHKYSVKKSMYF